MNRERFAWTVSVMLIALLAFQIPGSLAQRDDDYAFVRTLVDIHRHVASNYVEPVEDSKLREGAIEGMLGQLDPFTVYVPPARQEEFERLLEGSFKGVGIQLNRLDNGEIEVVTPIENSPAFKAGVMAGDIILKINGENATGLRLEEVMKKIAATPLGQEVKLLVRHATGEEVELSMPREEIQLPTIKGYRRAEDGSWDWYVSEDPKIAYIRITQFTSETYGKLRDALVPLLSDGMKGLILDLRFNPGGRLEEAEQVVDLFLEKGVIVSIRGRARAERTREASGPGTLPYFPMIVLVNEHSASASEIVAGSLMDNQRALVLGARTYGKGSVQEVVPLDSRSGELKLTVAYYYLPSGRLVHRKKAASDWGVEPQINVAVDEAGQRTLYRSLAEADYFRRPMPRATTRPATQSASAATQSAIATTQPVDIQLQRAVDTLIGLIVLQGNRGPLTQSPPSAPIVALRSDDGPAPTTAPATNPSQQ